MRAEEDEIIFLVILFNSVKKKERETTDPYAYWVFLNGVKPDKRVKSFIEQRYHRTTDSLRGRCRGADQNDPAGEFARDASGRCKTAICSLNLTPGDPVFQTDQE